MLSSSSNISSRCPHNMVNFGPLAAEIGLPVWRTPANFNGFRVLAALHCTVLQQWALAKLCGVKQRAPPIFGRAAITLDIGPYSSISEQELMQQLLRWATMSEQSGPKWGLMWEELGAHLS